MKTESPLKQRIQIIEKEIDKKDKRIIFLEEYILTLKQKQFGASSEKQEQIQNELFAKAEDESVVEEASTDSDLAVVAEHTRKKNRVSIPADLPRIDIIHDLADDQKICPHDGAALKNIGFDSHEQLDIIPAKIQVLHHKRLKYACPCCESYLITATKPAQPIEKSIASPGLRKNI